MKAIPNNAPTNVAALARRAAACRGWRWMPGMRTTDGMRVIHEPRLWPDRPCAIREGTWVDTAVPRPLGDHLPDLTDPATLGCLLALVREATTAYASLTFEPGYLHTEVENLVAALEAAP